MSDQLLQKSISGQNQYSDPIPLGGRFNLSLSGTWVAIVTVQRSFDDGLAWQDVGTFTVNGEYVGEEPERNVRYRLGVKTGEYTSGTVIARLSQ